MPILSLPDGSARLRKPSWLRESADHIERIEVAASMNGEAILCAWMDDGAAFLARFRSKSVLRKWLSAPPFKGIQLRWFGQETNC